MTVSCERIAIYLHMFHYDNIHFHYSDLFKEENSGMIFGYSIFINTLLYAQLHVVILLTMTPTENNNRNHLRNPAGCNGCNRNCIGFKLEWFLWVSAGHVLGSIDVMINPTAINPKYTT